ncbi:MAG: DUF2807 domain-containing protein [bacterium]
MNYRTFSLTILTTLILSFTGCIVIDSMNGPDNDNDRDAIIGSGKIITATFPFKNFSKILLNNSAKAKIRKSSTYSIQIALDDNIEKYMNAYQSSNEVSIGLDNKSYKNITFDVTIESPDLSSLNINGAASVTLEGFDLNNGIDIVSSGASVIRGYLTATEVNFNLTGASVVDLTGSASEMRLYGSGGTVFNLFNFPVKNCDVSLSGGSISNIQVSDILDLTLSGGSILKYKGNPVIRRTTISGGSIIQKVN